MCIYAYAKVFTDNTVKAMQELASKRRLAGEVSQVHDTKMIVLNRLKLQASIWAAQRCNLTRCQLGQARSSSRSRLDIYINMISYQYHIHIISLDRYVYI